MSGSGDALSLNEKWRWGWGSPMGSFLHKARYVKQARLIATMRGVRELTSFGHQRQRFLSEQGEMLLLVGWKADHWTLLSLQAKYRLIPRALHGILSSMMTVSRWNENLHQWHEIQPRNKALGQPTNGLRIFARGQGWWGQRQRVTHGAVLPPFKVYSVSARGRCATHDRRKAGLLEPRQSVILLQQITQLLPKVNWHWGAGTAEDSVMLQHIES